MTEAEWRASTNPIVMLTHLIPWAADRKLILFGCACLGASPYRFEPEVQTAIRNAERRAEVAPYQSAAVTTHAVPEHFDDIANAAACAWLFECTEPHFAAYHAATTMTGVGGPDAVPECAVQCAQLLRCVVPYPHPIPAPKPRGWLASASVGLLNLLAGNPARPAPRKRPSPPFLPVPICDPSWLTSTVVALAGGIYEERAFDRLPILADALMDAGCDHADVLSHCRSEGPHVRGCWVVDLLLGRA